MGYGRQSYLKELATSSAVRPENLTTSTLFFSMFREIPSITLTGAQIHLRKTLLDFESLQFEETLKMLFLEKNIKLKKYFFRSVVRQLCLSFIFTADSQLYPSTKTLVFVFTCRFVS